MAQKITVYILSLGCLCSVAGARMMPPSNTDRFEHFIDFTVTGITTPKVVRYETVESLGDFVALQDTETGDFMPVQLKTVRQHEPWNLPIESTSTLIDGHARALQDLNQQQSVTFDNQTNETKEIIFNNPTNHFISELHIDLAANTEPPDSISIQAQISNTEEWQTILQGKKFSRTLSFPQIQPRKLRLQFNSQNLLRISELEWTTTTRSSLKKQTLSFYAQENGRYRLFTQPSFGQHRITTQTNTPVHTNVTTPDFNLPSSVRNPNYDPDFDNDGLFDTQDLCPLEADATNADADKNGLGDACEDPDQDGFASAKDNCPFVPNRSQTDADKDGLGDACDPTEDRGTEQSDWWINLSFGIMILTLLGFVARSAWPMQKPKK